MSLDLHTAGWLHSLFEWAGMAGGAWLWRRGMPRQAGPMAPGNFAVLVGLLLGAGIGNKLVFLIERPDVMMAMLQGQPLWPGQSIVGGLLGGLIGVEIAKRLTHQTRSTGDAMVLPLVLGISLGRVGCFIAGLHDDTYGLPTALPWGVDFGDGLTRHPTQLYEIAVLALLGAALHHLRPKLAATPGLAFKLFLSSYLGWRFLVEFLKPVPVAYPLGFSGIQWTCLIALLLYIPSAIAIYRRPLSTVD